MKADRFYYYRDHREESFNISPGHFMSGRATSADRSAQVRELPSDCNFCDSVQLCQWQNCFDAEDHSREYTLGVCPLCGWWTTLEKWTGKYIPGYDSDNFLDYCTSLGQRFAILESFAVNEDEAPLGEIAHVLERDWAYSTQISPKKAQDLVLSVFKNHMECEVFYYDNSVFAPDGGIDFVLVRSDQRKIALQVKRRQTSGAESVRAVREFIGALANSPFDEGFFVTTAPLSSYAAKEVADGKVYRETKNIEVTVVDGSKLRQIMALHRPSTRSEAALMSILPATGWHSARFGVSDVHVRDILETVRNSAIPRGR